MVVLQRVSGFVSFDTVMPTVSLVACLQLSAPGPVALQSPGGWSSANPELRRTFEENGSG